MASLHWKVKAYLEGNGKTKAEFDNNIKLRDDIVDGVSNPYIHTWSVSGLAKPSNSQLDALNSNATIDYNNNRVDKTRRRAYGDLREQLDEIYHDIDAWKARLLSIKNSNPKS